MEHPKEEIAPPEYFSLLLYTWNTVVVCYCKCFVLYFFECFHCCFTCKQAEIVTTICSVVACSTCLVLKPHTISGTANDTW